MATNKRPVLDEMSDEATRTYFHRHMGVPMEPVEGALVSSGGRVWMFDGRRWQEHTDPSVFGDQDAADISGEETMRINVGAWMRAAETLLKPWARPMAIVDLTCHRVLSRHLGILFPEETELAMRWGWEVADVLALVEDRAAWDAEHTEADHG